MAPRDHWSLSNEVSLAHGTSFLPTERYSLRWNEPRSGAPEYTYYVVSEPDGSGLKLVVAVMSWESISKSLDSKPQTPSLTNVGTL